MSTGRADRRRGVRSLSPAGLALLAEPLVRTLRLVGVDQAVAVGVDALEVLGGAQELAGDVAVAVAVHLLKPERAAAPVERRGLPAGAGRHRGVAGQAERSLADG